MICNQDFEVIRNIKSTTNRKIFQIINGVNKPEESNLFIFIEVIKAERQLEIPLTIKRFFDNFSYLPLLKMKAIKKMTIQYCPIT